MVGWGLLAWGRTRGKSCHPAPAASAALLGYVRCEIWETAGFTPLTPSLLLPPAQNRTQALTWGCLCDRGPKIKPSPLVNRD